MVVRTCEVPLIGGGTMVLDLSPGQTTTIVGPNGSGKSALSASLSSLLANQNVNRIFAHRRLWLGSSTPEISAAQRAVYVQNFLQWDVMVDSRWRDHGDQYRAPTLIVDLIDRQNIQNAIIADHVRAGESTDNLQTDGPLQVLNGLLRVAALDVAISIGENSELVCTNTRGQVYPAAEMSDGEKAALLLLADVLVSESGSIQLIDEPERHLHRSISAPLIASLTQARPLDTFVIFTHDLELAQELGATGSTYVVSACEWDDKQPRAWALETVPPSRSLPEDLRRAVLGGRSRVVFHEGVTGGIDQLLYEALLTGRNVVPVGNCNAVLRSVNGLRQSQSLHWVDAAGIVDKDFRRATPPPGVRHLGVHEVENVFYLPLVLRHMSAVQAAHLGQDAVALELSAEEAIRSALKDAGVKNNILRQKRLQQVRDELLDQAQSLTTLVGLEEVTISAKPKGAELEAEYDRLLGLGTGDFLKIFPIRESSARDQATKALMYPSAEVYERAVIQQLRIGSELRDQVRGEIGIEGL